MANGLDGNKHERKGDELEYSSRDDGRLNLGGSSDNGEKEVNEFEGYVGGRAI